MKSYKLKGISGKWCKEEDVKKEIAENDRYLPTAIEFEKEYIRDLSSEDHCEHTQTKDYYYKLYNYTKWLEDKYKEIK